MSAPEARLQPAWRARLAALWHSDLTRSVAETYATRLLATGLGVISLVLMSRILGPAGRGLVITASSLSTLGVQFGILGLQSANTYLVARDRGHLPGLLANTLLVSLGLAGGAALLLGLGFVLFPTLAPVQGGLLLLACTMVPISVANQLTHALLMGLGQISQCNRLDLFNRAAAVGLVVLAALLPGASPERVFAASVVAAAVTVAWRLAILRGLEATPLACSAPLLRLSLAYGIRVYLNCLCAYTLQRIDVLMLRHLRGVEEVGYYSIATSLFDLTCVLPMAVSSILFPKLSVGGDRRQRWELTRTWMGWVGGALGLLAPISILLAPWVVRHMFGVAFLPAVPSFEVLAVVAVLYGANNVVGAYLAAEGMPWSSVWAWIAGCACNMALNLWLIPPHGAVGAALASLAGYLLVLLLQHAACSRIAAQPDVAAVSPATSTVA